MEEEELRKAFVREVIAKQQSYESYMAEKKLNEKYIEDINKLRNENVELLGRIRKINRKIEKGIEELEKEGSKQYWSERIIDMLNKLEEE